VDSIGFKEKVKNNTRLYNVHIDSAFIELDELINEAQFLKDSAIELVLLERKCRYFYQTNQLDLLISASEELADKANQYNDLYSQAMSYVYISEAYSANRINGKSIEYLEKAFTLLEKDQSNNRKIFIAKSNVLNSFANTYISMGEPEKAVIKIKAVISNYKELDNVSDIVRFQYLNYSNIANIYTLYNLDSAEFYALKSIELKPANVENDKVMLTNYDVLGSVYKEKQSYQTALLYYHKALDISEITGEQLNLKNLYSRLVEIYKILGIKDSAIIYNSHLNELEISSLQNKYTSLQLIMDKIDQSSDDGWWKWIIAVSVGVLLIVLGLFFFFIKRKPQTTEKDTEITYNSLIEFVKNNDPGFIFAFEQNFPEFSSQLLKINPTLSNTEIEFCALLKLNLSTKEIARYRFIETRTVQNRKHRIRKRLNIPSSADLYNWFNNIQ
jgi:DNA-binding CsgD family transcriptional regulator